MKYDFRKVTTKDVEDILTWKYEGIYSLYDNDIVQGKIDLVKGLPEAEKTFLTTFHKQNPNFHKLGFCL